MPQSVLVIVAHPDDETFGMGGTMARLIDEGHAVTVVCATRGEVGEISDPEIATPETLGQVREQELRDAMHELGVEDVRFLEYRDSGMAGTAENEDTRAFIQAEPMEVSMDLSAIMQEVNPDVVITWDQSGGYGHPDHVRVHETATDAFGSYAMRSGRPVRLYYTALPVHLFEEMQAELREQGVEFGSQQIRDSVMRLPRPPVTTAIDVTTYVEAKRRAMAHHRSQMPADSPFDKISEGLRMKFFGTEYFHRAVPEWHEGEPEEHALFDASAKQ
jgi:N-acetyl-1-D-myo-inositol-2-amino-2-deoxy-alpha-D-glucopyranoside deacetylase